MNPKDNNGDKFDFHALVDEAEAVAKGVVGMRHPLRCRIGWHAWTRWTETDVGQMRQCVECGKTQSKVDEDLNACKHHWHTVQAWDMKDPHTKRIIGEGYRQLCCKCGTMQFSAPVPRSHRNMQDAGGKGVEDQHHD